MWAMNADMDTAAPALCPKHPHVTATLTCERCGTFACESCRSPSEGSLCADCGARFAPVGLDVGDTLQQAFRVLLRHPQALVALGAASVAFGLATLPLTRVLTDAQKVAATDPLGALGSMLPAWGGLMLAGTVFSTVSYSIFIRFLGDALTGRERPPGELIREGLGRVPPMFGLSICLSIGLGIGFMMCLVPGILLFVVLAISMPAVVLHPAGPFEAMSLSWDRTQGHRMNVFLLLLIGGAICFGVAMFSGILSLLTQPLGLMGAVVGTTLSQALNSLGIALMLSILVLCYLRLTGRWIPATESR
jgi:hypothetical protein